jgi:hypothetical protein
MVKTHPAWSAQWGASAGKYTGRHSDHDNIGRSVRNNSRTSTNHRIATNLDQLANRSANSNPAEIPDLHTACQVGTGADVNRIPQFTIVIDAASGIQNRAAANSGIRIYDSPGKNH